MVVPVDSDAFDRRVGVRVVACESGWGFANADDQFVGDGVELDATTVERYGRVFREDSRCAYLSVRSGEIDQIGSSVDW